MLQFLILAGIAAMITIGCGGHYAFSYKRRGHFYSLVGLLIIVGYFASIIIPRYDNIVSNRFDWDDDGKLLVLGGMAVGVVFGIVLNVIVDWIVEEVLRRRTFRQAQRPLVPTRHADRHIGQPHQEQQALEHRVDILA